MPQSPPTAIERVHMLIRVHRPFLRAARIDHRTGARLTYRTSARGSRPGILSISQARVEQILGDTIRARELIGIRWDHRDTPLRRHLDWSTPRSRDALASICPCTPTGRYSSTPAGLQFPRRLTDAPDFNLRPPPAVLGQARRRTRARCAALRRAGPRGDRRHPLAAINGSRRPPAHRRGRRRRARRRDGLGSPVRVTQLHEIDVGGELTASNRRLSGPPASPRLPSPFADIYGESPISGESPVRSYFLQNASS